MIETFQFEFSEKQQLLVSYFIDAIRREAVQIVPVREITTGDIVPLLCEFIESDDGHIHIAPLATITKVGTDPLKDTYEFPLQDVIGEPARSGLIYLPDSIEDEEEAERPGFFKNFWQKIRRSFDKLRGGGYN